MIKYKDINISLEHINKLNDYIKLLDPYNVMIYNDDDIYMKEVKLLLKEEIIIPKKIQEIFNLAFKYDMDNMDAFYIETFINKNKLYYNKKK